MAGTVGALALVGGGEFGPGNEEQDALLAAECDGRPAYVVASAAARSDPDAAVRTATRWFQRFGIALEELPLRTAAQTRRGDTVERARAAGLIYLAGGDPGLTVRLLAGSPVWEAIRDAWLGGAALAGSSAGAMALCRWTLLREKWPVHANRRWADALDLVPGYAVVPHFDTFGGSWLPSAEAAAPDNAQLVGIDEHSAVVFHDGGWHVMGPGTVRVIRNGQQSRFASGDVVRDLPDPSAAR